MVKITIDEEIELKKTHFKTFKELYKYTLNITEKKDKNILIK